MLYSITDLERQELQKNFNFFLENAYKSENFDAEFENVRYILIDEVFTKIIIKKRNAGKKNETTKLH